MSLFVVTLRSVGNVAELFVLVAMDVSLSAWTTKRDPMVQSILFVLLVEQHHRELITLEILVESYGFRCCNVAFARVVKIRC